MKKAIVLLGLTLLAATPAMAQVPSIGVYFDAAGTQNTAILNGGFDEFHTAYVIGHAEALVGGAAFALDIFPRITILNAVYPAGIQIGDLYTGIEIGLSEPVIGFFNQPVLLGTLTLWTGEYLLNYARINVVPWWPRYESVMMANAQGALIPAAGRCSWLSVPVPNESNSWGNVKALYQ